MTNNSKKLYDISYSIKIDSSTYYIVGQRTKNLKYNTYFLAENAAIRSKSAIGSTTSLAHIHRSKSPKRTASPSVRRSKTAHDRRVIITKQQPQRSNQIHHRHYIPSKSKKINQTPDKTMKN
jgi:hemolysin activation/secretion protein